MTLAIDASVAAKWFFAEPGSAEARAVLESAEPLLAPDLLLAEVGNLAWKKLRTGAASPTQLPDLAHLLPTLFAQIVPTARLLPRALALAASLAHPLYDCLYLAAAEAADCPLLTADHRLAERLRGTPLGARVRVLAPATE